MRIGALKHQLSLQQRGAGRDAAGQPIETWTEVAKPWADIRYVSGVEVIRADATANIAKVSIQIRKRAGVAAGMRLVGRDGVVYRILDVLPDMRAQDRINLPCEVVNG